MQFVCAVCMQAMIHSVDNVPSQQAVELVVVALGFVEQCWLRLFLGDQLQWKMGWTGEMYSIPGFIIFVYEVVQKSFVKTVATVHLKSLWLIDN